MSGKIYCEHHGTTITTAGCVKRQTPAKQRNRWRMPWDTHCMSGQCKQGQEVLALHEKSIEPAPAATGAKPRKGGTTKWKPKPRKKGDGRGVKTCRKCETEYVIEEFYKAPCAKDGRDTVCRYCRLAAQKAKRVAASNSL